MIKCTQKVVSVLFFQKPLKHRELHLLVYSFLGVLNLFFGKFLLLITCSFQILAKCPLLTSDVSVSILVGIFLYDPTFLLSRLLISLGTSSDVISEN